MPYIPKEDRKRVDSIVKDLASEIAAIAEGHGYDGAFAGTLNYSLTRLLQEIPRELVKTGQFTEEMRYWFQPLLYGVLQDVALEHKLRVNTAYEAAQIVKSGDCYDTPYYTRLVEVVDPDGNHVGYQHVMVERNQYNLKEDILEDGKVILDTPNYPDDD